jgi:NitT/TauT family transport system permease protein
MLPKPAMIGLQILVFVALIALWWLAGALGRLDTSVLPPVGTVLTAFVDVLQRPAFQSAILNTIFDAARGLALAALIGIPLGVLIGMFQGVDRATRALIDFGRSFPVIALLPILVLLLGATATMKVVAITIACLFPILLQSIYGARRLEPTVLETIRAYRIPPVLRFRRVVLPAAGPYIATGLRISSTVSILVAVGVEIVSLAPGIGREISLSRSYNETNATYAYIIYAGLLGVALNLIWDGLETRFLGWHLRGEAE